MSDKLYLKWDEFDEAVDFIARSVIVRPPSLVIGQARGGLVLAVALSHRLNCGLEVLPKTEGRGPIYSYGFFDTILWVDDIIQTGKTYDRALRSIAFPRWSRLWTASWVSKIAVSSSNHIFCRVVAQDTWVVFPWEDPDRAELDREEYERRKEISRQ